MTTPIIQSEKEIEIFLKNSPDWKRKDNTIQASFEFHDFQTAFAFITIIAIQAEKQNHHPSWENNYKRVDFSLCTHSVGNKITNFDTKIAQYISKMAKKFM